MRAKKLLALLLSGAFFAGCLSGCDRTVIEHQFHTNTVTDTEYIEKEAASAFYKVKALLEVEGMAFKPSIVYLPSNDKNFPVFSREQLEASLEDGGKMPAGITNLDWLLSETDTTIAVSEFKNSGSAYIFTKQKSNGVNGFVSASSTGIDVMYEALQVCLMDEDWKQTYEGNSLICACMPVRIEDEETGGFYALVVATFSSYV